MYPDAQFATLSSQLLKREDDLKELKDILGDTVFKVRIFIKMFSTYLILL